ncbi:nitroreductase family protein [Streptomyces sp. NPDC050161]|uniref:nitroreductase family protein n=1 Tax=Streptomyces sp. NPDC050161 TaxID=3365604 RepID=UPI00378E7C64
MEPSSHATGEALVSMRATRWFTDRPVADEQLHRVLEAGRWTGSARNRQPWRFVVVRSPEARRRLALLGAYAGHLAGAPVAVALAIDEAAGGLDAQFDAGRVAQNMMLAAHFQGLGSCPATLFPDSAVDRAGEVCGIAAPWRVRTALSFGHPATRPAGTSAIPTGRRPLTDLVTEV